ncbi:MAG TPA: hypothetical protein VKA36_10080, partial [Solirubrobacterales bacterium]|nr:hypothetical protein [Solirubrobacterales bacterium]
MLAVDPLPASQLGGHPETEVTTLSAADRKALLEGTGGGGTGTEQAPPYDYAVLGGGTLAEVNDLTPVLAGLAPLCRCGALALSPAPAPRGAEGWQALPLDWDRKTEPHLLLLRSGRPADGLDGSLSRDSEARALTELSSERIKSVSATLENTLKQALRERAQRERVQRELERFRGWPLARRVFRSAVFSARHRWALERRREPGAGAAASETPIFFVVGRGKSGTSWL